MTQKKLDKLQMRAYQVIDEIENKGDQRAKYQYLEIMTTILLFDLGQPARDPHGVLLHGGLVPRHALEAGFQILASRQGQKG